MLSERIERYTPDSFDYDGHIAVFLHTSAVYLGVNEDHAWSQSNRAWHPKPACFTGDSICLIAPSLITSP